MAIKKMWLLFVAIFVVNSTAAYAVIVGANDLDIDSTVSESTLNTIKSKNILFGHQSVGYNILTGLTELDSKYHLVNIDDFSVGSNGDPTSKINDFGTHVNASYDCAFFKFCYVDFSFGDIVENTFNEYKAKISALRAAYPNVKIVHMTVPLTTGSSTDNISRHSFNEMLRAEYNVSTDYIYDLAEIESTHTDGTRSTFSYGGQAYYSLCSEYTDDGGHLNELGRNHAARGLIAFLAAIYRESGYSHSTYVHSTNSVQVIAERAMYWDAGGTRWAEGHSCAGVTSTSNVWYLAEGSTLNTFSEWVLIQNPNSTDSLCDVTFMKSDGSTVSFSITINAHSRQTIHVNEYVPNDSVSTMVESTNGVGVIVERAMYWDAGGVHWAGGHCSPGVTSTATKWYLAEGATLWTFDEWVLIQNPNSTSANCRVTFMRPDGSTVEENVIVVPTSRFTIHVNQLVLNESVSTTVESTNGIGIVVERAMYWDTGGVEWAGGHCSAGVSSDATTWYLAEGSTNGFEEYVLIQNPNNIPAEVTVTFMEIGGTTIAPISKTINAHSRESITVSNYVSNGDVSTKVESKNGVGVIAERAMYWNAGGVYRKGGHCSPGVTSTSESWYLAEGSTNGFSEWILLQNPNSIAAAVTLTIMKADGTTLERYVSVPATSRYTVEVNKIN